MFKLTSTNNLAAPAVGDSAASQSSLSRYLIMIWLLGTVLLAPVKIFTLPHNIELVDFWVLMALPVLWLSFIFGRHARISLPYTVAMLLILLGSFVSTFAAQHPLRSLIVILKEIYLFVWFVTVAVLFSRLHANDLRRIMLVWSGAVILHGLLIIAQFLSPDVWQMTAGLVGKPAAFVYYRPSGLFMSQDAGDANKAALFQLLGFAPLLLSNHSRRTAMVLALVLVCSILATGSMGTTVALTTGLITAIIATSVFGQRGVLFNRHFVQLIILLLFFGGGLVFVLNQNQDRQTHFENILVGRSERSAEGRFDLWERGRDVFLDRKAFFLGVGPGNFREVDGMDKQLHNDVLAFTVERGLFTTLALVLFAGVMVSRGVALLKLHSKYPQRVGIEVVVFLATFVAILAASLTHQIFHIRELWSVLALQEAMFFRFTSGTLKMAGGKEATMNRVAKFFTEPATLISGHFIVVWAVLTIFLLFFN